ncbi:putative folate-biopterin transporter 6 [Nymphaea thermarum]|nr:putative folate-biopterin transporter 6 [Nymphaea thermarum]
MRSHEIQSLEEKQCLVVNPEPRVLQNNGRRTFFRLLREPFDWLSMLCRELETSFILAIIVVYGFSQGFSGSFFKVVTDYYWKDVQQMQPSAVQLYQGLYVKPWIMKPIWGLLTDVFSISGYKRRPYFVLAGTLGSFCALLLLQKKPPVLFALIFLTGISAAMSIADVTIDACIARSSIQQPALASDMQSLCGFVSSTGAILGYSTSGMLVHTLGAQGALGLLALPLTMIITLGFTMTEAKSMIRTDKKPDKMDADDNSKHKTVPSGDRGNLLCAAHVHRQHRFLVQQMGWKPCSSTAEGHENRFQELVVGSSDKESAEDLNLGSDFPSAQSRASRCDAS